jgi:hypothetical protein
MRRVHVILSSAALLAAVVFSGCSSGDPAAQAATKSGSGSVPYVASLTLPSGTVLDVTLNTSVSSENANVGDTWSGSIRNASIVDGKNVIPAGSSVAGTVLSVTSARKGDRAALDLVMNSVTVGDHTYKIHGTTDAVVAGSPRARNLGAIAGSAAAGALIGKAVGGSGKDALIGGIVGGGVATGVVAGTKGWQVVLKEGTPLTFTTNEAVAVRP